MTRFELSSETIHASCVAIDGRAVLLHGASGSGKSDLAFRLIDRGASLVSDDYTILRNEKGRLIAEPPPTIEGRIEVRGVGIVRFPPVTGAEVCLLLLLDQPVPRLPEDPRPTRRIAGVEVPVLAIAAFEASAPLKVELALRQHGISG
jgi:hypothetical protein